MSKNDVYRTLKEMGDSGSLEDVIAWFKKSGKEGHRVKIRDSLIRLSKTGCVKQEGNNWIIVGEFKEKHRRKMH